MKVLKYLFAIVLAVCVPVIVQAQFFTQNGSFNTTRHAVDLSPDNKIGIVLTNDSSTTKSRLSTVDPLAGTTLDSTTCGGRWR